jgi:hypothetical protein
VAKRYGDVFKLFFVMNEPWESGSISGWDANGQHLRNLTKALYRGVHRAEKEVWPEPKTVDQRLMVGGVDGDANNFDNLLTEPGMEKSFDAFTVHTYSIRVSDRFLFGLARKMGKPIYDTESWDDPVDTLKSWCFNASMGVLSVSPFSAGVWLEQGKIGRYGVVVSALLHFLQDTRLYKEVNPQCMPYIFLFRSDDGKKVSAVVFGRPRNPPACQGQEWDQIRVDGEMTLDDPAGEFTVYDEFGNPLEKKDGRWTIPLTAPAPDGSRANDFYVTTRGDADKLAEALARAKLSGVTPAQIEMDDFTKPLGENPDLVVRVANALNEPLSGTVSVEVEGGIRLAEKEKSFAGLESGKKVELRFTMAGGTPNGANYYPVRVTVKTERGEAVHSEGLSVACIVKGTPQMDGNVEEWTKLGAIPVYLQRKRLGDPWGAARYMWMEVPKYDEKEGDFAQAAAAWDEKNFYVMMKIKSAGSFKFPTMRKINYVMQRKPAEYVYLKTWWPRANLQIAFNCIPLAAKKDLLGMDPASPTLRRHSFPDSDYLHLLYETDEGGEVWRSRVPGARFDHWYPFSPPPPAGVPPQKIVDEAKLVFRHDEKQGVWYVECAIPLSELADLKPEPGKQIGFSFDVAGIGHWSEGRSACKLNCLTFSPMWSSRYSCQTQWGFVGARGE